VSCLFLLAIKTRRWWIQVGQVVLVTGTILSLLSTSVAAKQLAPGTMRLVINIPSFTLRLLEDDKVVKTYPVAVGKPSAPTPVGDFKIISKVVNPTWYPPDGSSPVLPGPNNPLGQRWLGFLPSGYGIHGNNNSSSIGKAVSLGCVRMHNADVEELFARIPVGVDLEITYETVDVEADPTTGQTYLVFHPDVYRRRVLTVAAVQDKLQALGLPNYSSEERIAEAIASSRSRPTYVCLGMKVRVAGQEVVVDTEVVNGETLVALRPIAESFGMSVAWDPKRQSVSVGAIELSPHVKAGQSFVHLSDLETQLGIRSNWCEPEQILELSTWQVMVEQESLPQGAWGDEDGVWLPAGAIARALKLSLKLMPERAVVVDSQNREWPGKVQGNDIFVLPQTLTEMLPIKVIMLSDQRVIDITRLF
jgi:L,D-transpeptidase ErfK/SrfK